MPLNPSHFGAAGAVALAAFVGAPASAEFGQTLSGFQESPAPIAPSPDFGVGSELFGAVDADTDVVTARAGFGWTFYDGIGEHVTLWGEGFAGFGEDDFFGGSLGPAYRARVSEDWAVGSSFFVDLGAIDGDILPAFGAGLEAEHIFDAERNLTLRLGVNGYFALRDAGEIAEYGELERAPQTGGDVYARLGEDFDGFRLDVTVGGFYYAGGDDTDSNLGGMGALGVTVWDGLPEGMALSGHVGPRFMTGGGGDDGDDSELSAMGGLQLSYAWGGTTTTTTTVIVQPSYDPARDCVLGYEGDGSGYYDCDEPVLYGFDGETKEGDELHDDRPAPEPRLETVEVEIPGVRPVEPLRHLGFGSPFTPLAR